MKKNSKYQSNVHNPVLIDSIIENINKGFDFESKNKISDGITFLDGTFGGGGYFYKIYTNFSQKNINVLNAIAVDLDINANHFFENIKNDLSITNCSFVHNNFSEAIKQQADSSLDLIVLDLGFSTNQLELSDIGLSYKMPDQPFDLRFNNTSIYNQPAWKMLKKIKTADELSRIIYNNSGEEFSRKIAIEILKIVDTNNQNKAIHNHEIVQAINTAIPEKYKKKSFAILSRVYQAFRIWVNDELNNLDLFLDEFADKLKKNGMLMIVSFHSLEDKLVTKKMRQLCKPIILDEYGNKQVNYNLLTKKAVVPSQNEITANPKSRSALLRIIQKLN